MLGLTSIHWVVSTAIRDVDVLEYEMGYLSFWDANQVRSCTMNLRTYWAVPSVFEEENRARQSLFNGFLGAFRFLNSESYPKGTPAADTLVQGPRRPFTVHGPRG